MSPEPAAPRRSDPRRRLIALGVLLVLSLGFAAALAVQAIATASRHRRAAERALHDYADFAAFILASHAYRQVGAAVVEAFAHPGPFPAAQQRAVPAGFVCPRGTTWFEQRPGTAVSLFGAPLDSSDRAFLADTLKNARTLLDEVGWRFRWVRMPDSRDVQGFFVVSHQVSADVWALRGFTACLGGEPSPLRRIMLSEPALPPSVTGDLPPDSLYGLEFAGASGRLYASPVRYDSPYHGVAKLGTAFGDLEARVALRADIASRLLIGGIPSSSTPLAIGLLALSTLLVVTALLQLRREYELMAIRSDFVSSVSHELRTPLSQMLFFTELLKMGKLRSDAEKTRALDILDQEVRRLIRLVENVLQFSRGGLRARPAALETVPLRSVARETIEAFRPLADAHGAVVRLEAPDEAPVVGNQSTLRQILLNLLDNAMKYGPKGQVVIVSLAGENGRTLLAVEDQGPGIPLEERERVFEEFYRLPRERQSAVAGSGIGLSVVRALAADMGGRAWIEDAPAGGARVVLELATAEAS